MFLLYYLRDMIQLILAPVKGWEDISADDYGGRELLVRGFIPFIAIASLTVLLRLLYSPDASFTVGLQQMVVCFVKYFVSYYLSTFLFTLFLPTCIEGELRMVKVQTFILYGLGLLALVNIIKNCIPVELALSFMMPVYVLYILWRGLRYMNISFSGVGTFILLIIFALIAPPYALQYVFNFILPKY